MVYHCSEVQKGRNSVTWHMMLRERNTVLWHISYLLHGAESLLSTNWFAASQEIPRISRNPKVHYRTHKRPPPVSILGQLNPVHISTSHLLEIHPNIIHPSTPRSHQWFLSLQFSLQDPIQPPLLTHTRHMPNPSHSSRFYHPHNFGLLWKQKTEIFDRLIWSELLNKYSA